MKMLTPLQKSLLTVGIYTLPLIGIIYLLVETGVNHSPAQLAPIGVAYALAVYMVIAWHVQINIEMNGVRQAVRRLRTGDLDSSAGSTGRGGIGVLFEDVLRMNRNLGVILDRVQVGADTIDHTAGKVATQHIDLAQRTEEHASTLKLTASVMEKMAATVNHNADHCLTASKLSKHASDIAEHGAEMMHQAVERMELIGVGSKKIGDIIGVIEQIAFKTNILALNAMVEAAKAQEQGRAFSVVANEVRNLAQKSKQAAAEVRTLIEESVSSFAEGGRLVSDAGRTIDEIVANVQQVTELIMAIAVASRQQSAGVAEINKALRGIKSMTQQNVTVVDTATTAALAFEQQAKNLLTALSQFKFSRRANTETK